MFYRDEKREKKREREMKAKERKEKERSSARPYRQQTTRLFLNESEFDTRLL